MLVAVFEKVAVVAKREAGWAQAVRDLYEHIRGEIDRADVAHNEEMAELRTIVVDVYQQLEEARSELERSPVEAKVFKTLVENLEDKLETLEARANEAMAALEAWSKSEVEW